MERGILRAIGAQSVSQLIETKVHNARQEIALRVQTTFLRVSAKMTKLMQVNLVTLARTLVICAPALLLGACASQEAVQHAQATADQALSTANHAEATANQALSVAHQAEADAKAARAAASRMYQRGLRK